MPPAHVDLAISARWIMPLTTPAALLDDHTLLVRDGRIVELLPTALALTRYAPAAVVTRASHLIMPGLVNAYCQLGGSARTARPDRVRDTTLAGLAALLAAGTTCVVSTGFFPAEAARSIAEQGMRAVLGVPIAAAPSTWADHPSDYLTRALSFRDEYREHPALTIAFALHDPSSLTDDTFRRIATLADELETGIVMELHDSAAAVAAGIAAHGKRPIERIHALGLLTPAVTAVHMNHATPADVDLAQHAGISLALCPQAALASGAGAPPLAAWLASDLRLALGSGGADTAVGLDLWEELRLATLLAGVDSVGLHNRRLLAAASRGGAAALGLETQIGTLETGKWADVCCLDLSSPAIIQATIDRPRAAGIDRLALYGGRNAVSDVWVAGRHLIHDRAFTRLDWPALRLRLDADSRSTTVGGPHDYRL